MKRALLRTALVAFVAAQLSCAMVDRLTGEAENRKIREVGVPAEALVVQIWDTGITVNNDPVVGFELEVFGDDIERYRAETKARIPRLFIPQIQPGHVLPVKYDPADPQRVALDIYEER
jgi:hypothetical protein